MIIKSLKLKNFRQFQGEENELIFATDNELKTTLIIGNNTTGKTTLLESFSWILYGESDLKSYINTKQLKDMKQGETLTIKGELIIEHKGVEYSIIRTTLVEKKAKTAPQTHNQSIYYKTKEGLSERIVDQVKFDSKIREILPKEMFNYFFFKGEKIEEIGAEISDYNAVNKSKEFVRAVRGLLGFEHLTNAIKHLKSLDNEYNRELASSNTDKELRELSREKESYQEELEKQEERLTTLEKEVDYYLKERDRLHQQILLNKDVEDKQKESRKLETTISDIEKRSNELKKKIFSDFSSKICYVAANRLIPNIIKVLNDSGSVDKGVPGVEAKAIEHIIKSKKCLCGTTISEGTDQYNKLKDLLDYIPPNYIGNDIRVFVTKTDSIKEISKMYTDSFDTDIGFLSSENTQINYFKDEKASIDEFLINADDVKTLKEEEQVAFRKLSEKQQELGSLKTIIKNLETELEKVNNKIAQYDVKDVHYRKIRNYSLYAQEARRILEKDFQIREERIKSELSEAINDTFKNIFETNVEVNLDENYNIIIESEEFDDPSDFEHSTSQHGILAFSFIAGIIKLARKRIAEKSLKKNADLIGEELEIEPYPLVMDAPSSSFDTKRIKSFTKAVLKTAEQVILIIKDTDGNYAREYLKETIGKEYELIKISDFKTEIKEGIGK